MRLDQSDSPSTQLAMLLPIIILASCRPSVGLVVLSRQLTLVKTWYQAVGTPVNAANVLACSGNCAALTDCGAITYDPAAVSHKLRFFASCGQSPAAVSYQLRLVTSCGQSPAVVSHTLRLVASCGQLPAVVSHKLRFVTSCSQSQAAVTHQLRLVTICGQSPAADSHQLRLVACD